MDSSLGPPADPPGSFFRPLLISLSIVAGISITLLTYHVILVKFCIRRGRRLANARAMAMQGCDHNLGLGVEEHVLKAIPVVNFSSNDTELAQNECVICLGELEEGDKVRSLPNCGHLFHVPCIDGWLSAHTNCPICRAPIIGIPILDISSVIEDSRRDRPRNSGRFFDGDRGSNDSVSNSNNDNGNTSMSSSSSSSLSSSSSMLFRHSLSLILPMEIKRQRSRVLNRSLSMDHCFVINIIDIKDEESENGSSSSSLPSLKGFVSNCRSFNNKGTSTRLQIDNMPSRFLR